MSDKKIKFYPVPSPWKEESDDVYFCKQILKTVKKI